MLVLLVALTYAYYPSTGNDEMGVINWRSGSEENVNRDLMMLRNLSRCEADMAMLIFMDETVSCHNQ